MSQNEPINAVHVELAAKILNETEKMFTELVDDAGELIIDKVALNIMTNILQEGVAINNYIVEHQLYTDNADIQDILGKLGKQLSKIEINDANAKKLDFRKGLKTWAEIHGLIVALATNILNVEK